jgi:hypothetical protein
LEELAASIQARGIEQPLTVRWEPEAGKYRIIDGERRYRAAGIAQFTEVPCLLKEADSRNTLIDQIVHNWQRADLLRDQDVIALPERITDPKAIFTKSGKGQHTVRFHVGPHFRTSRAASLPCRPGDSPLYDPLHTIGLEDPTIRHVLRIYDPRLVAECADMTLAARERFGEKFFKVGPQAYFIDNLKAQAARTRTPPDWWRDLRKEEERRKWQADREEPKTAVMGFDAAFDAYLQTEAREAFQRVTDRVFHDLTSGGQSESEAQANARYFTRTHFIRRFRAEHPEWNDNGPVRAGDILAT